MSNETCRMCTILRRFVQFLSARKSHRCTQVLAKPRIFLEVPLFSVRSAPSRLIDQIRSRTEAG